MIHTRIDGLHKLTFEPLDGKTTIRFYYNNIQLDSFISDITFSKTNYDKDRINGLFSYFKDMKKIQQKIKKIKFSKGIKPKYGFMMFIVITTIILELIDDNKKR